MVELIEGHGDLGSTRFTWSPFLLCGKPGRDQLYYAGADPERCDELGCPDNLALDPDGRLWITTDGQPGSLDANDGVYAVATHGPERGRTRRFLSAPKGSEVTGPEFTPDGRTLFLSVQHPGEGAGLERPGSQWPHGGGGPKPSVVVIERDDREPLGT